MDTIRSDLVLEGKSPAGLGEVALDHMRRVLAASRGFRVYGNNWIGPWFAYAISPLTRRIFPNGMLSFRQFNVRTNQCDLYTFANVFVDYPFDAISRALDDVELVIDIGANVGAFSCAIETLCRKIRKPRRIVAIEPDPGNISMLRAQPFAERLEIREAAIGPSNGTARLIPGDNSVTHRVDFTTLPQENAVTVLTLESICTRPALVKMDVEGAELSVLQRGLPDMIKHLVMEWHYEGSPADFVSGNWRRISSDLHGANTWHFIRTP